MKEQSEIRAAELVWRIRDEQAGLLTGKSDAEVIDYFERAAGRAREAARKRSEPRRASA